MRQEFDFRQAVITVHENLGGKATRLEVATEFRRLYPDEFANRTLAGFAGLLGPILTSKDAFGLPRAASFPAPIKKPDPRLLSDSPEELENKKQGGIYVMRKLWTEDDYKFTIRKYYKRARDNDALAEKLAAEAAGRWPATDFTPSVLWADGPEDVDDEP